MDFKWIGFLIKWILNRLDQRKSGLDHENWIFYPPLYHGSNEDFFYLHGNHKEYVE